MKGVSQKRRYSIQVTRVNTLVTLVGIAVGIISIVVTLLY